MWAIEPFTSNNDNVPHDYRRGWRAACARIGRALATSLPAEAGPWPYASLVLTAVDHDLSPILLLSDLAEHSKAIMATTGYRCCSTAPKA
jgi:hypothetical protein